MTTAVPGSVSGPLRTAAGPDDLARLQHLLGAPVRDADAPSVLDPRGLRFQRLEWLGDSVLDALLAVHRASSPGCCSHRGHADLSSDAALARAAASAGVLDHLDWHPSAGRSADWVEAAVGAVHLAAGWPGSATCAGRLVHAELASTAAMDARGAAVPPARPRPTGEPCRRVRRPAAVGAHVLEGAAAIELHARHPDADEGTLSALRGALLDGRRLLAQARRAGRLPSCGGSDAHLVDHLQAAVGAVACSDGLTAGTAEARTLLLDA